MNEDYAQMKRDLEELKDWKKSLENSSSIPLNIDQSFRARFVDIVHSTKVRTSENVEYDGLDAVTTLDTPSHWVQLKIRDQKASPVDGSVGRRLFIPVWEANATDPI